MFDSKCVASSSRGGPLWVAAYCFKRLKKAQVFETDISSSVDKILQDEMDVVSYRVLAYLLLGVVRIYSKKVEYLFHDCNEVLIKIKKFAVNRLNTKDKAQVETLRMSISIPDRFELDAFDLDMLEDFGGGHIAPLEDITLKDVLCKTEGFGQFSLDKYRFEEFDFCENTCSADHVTVEDVRQCHLMDTDFEVASPNSPINLQTGNDKIKKGISSQVEAMNVDTVYVVEELHTEPENLFSQDKQINEDQTVQETAPYEDEIHEERSRISQEDSVDICKFSGREKEPVLSVEPFNESHHVEEEQIMGKETSSSLSQMHQEIREAHETQTLQESIESPQDDQSCQKECMGHDKSSVAKENLEEHIEGSVEGHDNECKLQFQEKVSPEDGKFDVIPQESKHLDVTPQSKFRDGSVGRPKPGATTPEFMLTTPAARERARFSRKRKRVIDKLVVLPNELLRKSIHDASDLISNRRKIRHTLLAKHKQRQSRISSLPDGFYKSLLPCNSLELQSLFSNEKMKVSDSLEVVKTPGKLDESGSKTVDRLEHNATALQIATAPQTPPRSPKMKIRSVEYPEYSEIQKSDNVGPSSLHESTEREQSLQRDEELDLMQEFNVGTSHQSLETQQCFTKYDDLNLMNEEKNSCETKNSELSGWSERTRKVARYLHRNFLDLSKQREEEIVKVSRVLEGRVRKECARLFYEILVLRTTSFVDVKQKDAYGDISIWKLPKLDQTFGIDGL